MDLGDSLYSSGGSRQQNVGIKKILRNSDEDQKIRQFAMETFQLDVLKEESLTSEEERKLRQELSKAEEELKSLKNKIVELEAFVEETRSVSMQEGVMKGRDEGSAAKELEIKEEYLASLGSLEDSQKQVLHSLANQIKVTFLNIEEEAAYLALACVKQVFDKIPSEYEDGILSVVKKAVQTLNDQNDIHVKVNPKDFDVIIENKKLWILNELKMDRVTVEANENVQRGSCYIESETSNIEMDLNNVMETFKEEVESIFRLKSTMIKNEIEISNQEEKNEKKDVIKEEVKTSENLSTELSDIENGNEKTPEGKSQEETSQDLHNKMHKKELGFQETIENQLKDPIDEINPDKEKDEDSAPPGEEV